MHQMQRAQDVKSNAEALQLCHTVIHWGLSPVNVLCTTHFQDLAFQLTAQARIPLRHAHLQWVAALTSSHGQLGKSTTWSSAAVHDAKAKTEP